MNDREFRVAVGNKAGLRSAVWKFIVRKNDVYIFTRMFGRDAKVSLHESGQSQWSATSDWVRGDSSRRNADRHLVKWTSPCPLPEVAAPVFRVLVPESELRTVASVESTKGVRWIPAPPMGATYAFDCFITPPRKTVPIANQAPYRHLKSMPLKDSRWFIVLVTQVTVGREDLEVARRKVVAAGRAAGLRPGAEHRAALFFQGEGTTPGMIEVALL